MITSDYRAQWIIQRTEWLDFYILKTFNELIGVQSKYICWETKKNLKSQLCRSLDFFVCSSSKSLTLEIRYLHKYLRFHSSLTWRMRAYHEFNVNNTHYFKCLFWFYRSLANWIGCFKVMVFTGNSTLNRAVWLFRIFDCTLHMFEHHISLSICSL